MVTVAVLVTAAVFVIVLVASVEHGPGMHMAPAPPEQETIAVEASEFRFEPSTIESEVGRFVIVLHNIGREEHDFIIEGVDDPEAAHLIHAMTGQTSRGSYDLEDGSYSFYCSIPGHRQAGMEGTLSVG